MTPRNGRRCGVGRDPEVHDVVFRARGVDAGSKGRACLLGDMLEGWNRGGRTDSRS